MRNPSMGICSLWLILISCYMVNFLPLPANAQTTDIVILNAREAGKLRILVSENAQVGALYDSINGLATKALAHNPQSLSILSYEGMLPTHPDRVATEESLQDMDMVVNLIYASYVESTGKYGAKANQFVFAWSNSYIPTGNPINENKLSALFWPTTFSERHLHQQNSIRLRHG